MQPLLLLLLVLPAVFTLTCYQQVGVSNKDKPKDTFDCVDGSKFCMKISDSKSKTTQHACDGGICDTRGIKAGKCKSDSAGGTKMNTCCCDKDKCNGTPVTGVLSAVLVALLGYKMF